MNTLNIFCLKLVWAVSIICLICLSFAVQTVGDCVGCRQTERKAETTSWGRKLPLWGQIYCKPSCPRCQFKTQTSAEKGTDKHNYKHKHKCRQTDRKAEKPDELESCCFGAKFIADTGVRPSAILYIVQIEILAHVEIILQRLIRKSILFMSQYRESCLQAILLQNLSQ